MSIVAFKDLLVYVIIWYMYWLIFSHTSGITISKRRFVPLSILLLGVVYHYQLLGYSLSVLVFCGIYYYHYPRESISKYLFYSFFPVVTVDIFSRMMALYVISPLLDLTPEALNNNAMLLSISYGTVFPIYYFLNKILDLDFQSIQNGKTARKLFLARIFNLLLATYHIMLASTTIIRIIAPKLDASFFEPLLTIAGGIWLYRQQVVFIFVVFYFWLLSEINHEAKLEMDRKLKKAQADKIKALEDYNQQIEWLYNDIQQFKDEFDRTFEELRVLIDQGDVKAISDAYGRMIAGRQVTIDQSQYELGRLVNLKVSPIKSILSAKMIEAQSQNIEAFLEIPDVITDIYMGALDLVIILSVFLDNAIEAARETKRPHVSVAFFEREDSQLLIVENSITKNSVDISKIFHTGYSTKGPNRGIGLSNVQRILENYPQAMLSTKTGQHSFTQILEMRQES
ncbi:GHKL domain-containing protein [Streptococcus pluranimalium]|uniref:GHKL domain-containing protein n=1 Tax=Streptococcus pluranimalium TaxID=82348 RepID=UPI0039FC7064